jgi:hypothetical protein
VVTEPAPYNRDIIKLNSYSTNYNEVIIARDGMIPLTCVLGEPSALKYPSLPKEPIASMDLNEIALLCDFS